jgi:hypothetical protein
MSLRPSEREQMRKGNYKQTVDAEESRRRREGQMVDIRKAKREESLQKKRRDGFPASAAGAAPPMGHSTALQQKVRRCPGSLAPDLIRPPFVRVWETGVVLDLTGSDLILSLLSACAARWLAGDGAGRPLQRPRRAA